MAAIRCKVRWAFRAIGVTAAVLCTLGTVTSLHAQEGTLQTIRNDVRDGTPPNPSSSSSSATSASTASQGPVAAQPLNKNQPSNDSSDTSATDAGGTFAAWVVGGLAAGAAALSPFWVPRVICDDDWSRPAPLHQFPYDDTTFPADTFPFAIRLDADYVEAFDNLERINGHILISTASRFELDARCQHLEEHLSGGGLDELWNGDCNLTYRFAQCDWGQFRIGLGMNWLNDPTQTDLGFNFTYGADIYPARPWVFSAVMDAGTLGHAGLFRFRTTVGAIYRSVELYTGYEYADIGSVHWNGLVGGMRLWF